VLIQVRHQLERLGEVVVVLDQQEQMPHQQYQDLAV
jgi:hypothetical protein